MNLTDKYQRYQRQILLKEFGTAGQEKLSSAKVLIVGAGGLGCPALQYLAAAGVGTISIVDFDVVDISNLQRQVLYSIDDIGMLKAEAAAKKLKLLNPDIKIQAFNFEVDTTNALQLISDSDLIVDGSDNFSTRYLVNDACVLLGKPLVYGAVQRFEGQVGVFNLADSDTNIKTNYRDLFPVPPDTASTLSCNEAGVLGVLPGIIGTLQATETIKIITGIGKPLINKIVCYNALNNSFYEFSISQSGNAYKLIPKSEKAFLEFDYNWYCGVSAGKDEITTEEFDKLRTTRKITIIDVREDGELPSVCDFIFTQIPLSTFEKTVVDISTENKIVLFCQTGIRSLKALHILKEKRPDCMAYSLKGGISAWEKAYLNRSRI